MVLVHHCTINSSL